MITVKLENRTFVLSDEAVNSFEGFAEHMGHHYKSIRHAPARRAMMRRDYTKICNKILR